MLICSLKGVPTYPSICIARSSNLYSTTYTLDDIIKTYLYTGSPSALHQMLQSTETVRMDGDRLHVIVRTPALAQKDDRPYFNQQHTLAQKDDRPYFNQQHHTINGALQENREIREDFRAARNSISMKAEPMDHSKF